MDTLEKNILLSDARLEQEKRYWLKQLADCSAMTRISYQALRSGREGHSRTKQFYLNDPLSDRLIAVSRSSDYGLFILLLAGVSYVLHRYTGDSSVICGIPVITSHTAGDDLLNPLILLKSDVTSSRHSKEFIAHIKEKLVEADKHQNFPFELLLDMIGIDQSSGRHCNVIAMMEGVHEEGLVDGIAYDCRFEFRRSSDRVSVQIRYRPEAYDEVFISQLFAHYEQIMEQLLFCPEKPLQSYDLAIEAADREHAPGPENGEARKCAAIHAAFEEQADKNPEAIAIVEREDTFTYEEIDHKANQIARYLLESRRLTDEERVGIMLDNSSSSVISMLGILKAGGTYVPIDPEFPIRRIKAILEDGRIRTVISSKNYIRQLNKLQWEIEHFEAYLCLDTEQIDEEEEQDSEFMSQGVWNFVADQATDDISGGAWVNSYTREDLSREEMDEYANNIKQKLLPYVNKKTRVLEIGCASGISMFALAPYAGFYYGTDLSSSMIRNCQARVQQEGHHHVKLACLPADQIDQLGEDKFDVIILNSVVQVFKGHHYLRKVLRAAIELLADRGILFIGDIMDQDSKDEFLRDLAAFNEAHPEYKTKKEFENELFLSRGFFRDFQLECDSISGIEFSDKIYTIPNELTMFRYDAILQVDKTGSRERISAEKRKRRHDVRSLRSFATERVAIPVPSDGAAYVLYTSGSTGKPKGVVVEHRNVVHLFRTAAPLFSFDAGDVWSLFHSTSFDFSVWEIFGALLHGAKLVIVPRSLAADPQSFVRLAAEQHITILSQTPSAFYQFAHEAVSSRAQLPGLRTVVFGGEPLQPVLLKKWKDAYPGVKLVNMYGITETTVHVTYKELTDADIRHNSLDIGTALPSYQVHILDPWLRRVPAGVVGEMYVGGTGVAREYLNQEQLTSQKFKPSPFHDGERLYQTGDLARWNMDGTLEYIGRIDDQVKIRGYRMELGEITTCLLTHKQIHQASVQVLKMEDGSKELCVYYVANEPLSVKEVKEYTSKRLPQFMVPSYFVALDKMPLTLNGKLDKRRLPDPLEVLSSNRTMQEPLEGLERELADIFRDILGIDAVGRNDSFFDLGGHSLKAARLVQHLHKRLHCGLALRDIFQFPTIKELAEHMRSKEASSRFVPIQPAEQREYYPLSSAQKRLYILEQFEDIGTSYNMPFVLQVEGPLDIGRVRDSYRQLLHRHEILRTSFHVVNDEPVQRIEEMEGLQAELICEEAPEAGEAELAKRIEAFIRPFRLSEAPLIRMGIIRIGPEKHLLLLDMHHIISDGTSLNIWVDEFMKLYKGDSLAPLAIQYKDYAVWQQAQMTREAMRRQKEFWRNELSGEVPVLQLPTDYPRPAVQDFQGSQYSFRLGRRLSGQIEACCRESGVTLYMLLLAAYQVLLHKYTGQEDIIVGTPVAGRGHADLEGVLGMFVNTLAIRSRPQGDKTFSEFLQEVKNAALNAFEHPDYPFEELVQELNAGRDTSRNPLFDTMFALQNMDTTTWHIANLRARAYEYDWKSAKFDLLLQAEQDQDDICLTMEYAASLFRRETMERFADCLIRVLDTVTEHADKPIKDVDIVSEREKEYLTRQGKGERLPFAAQAGIAQLFEAQVLRTPNRIAIRSDDQGYTYEELNAKANQLARMLRSKGVGRGSMIAIRGERSFAYAAAILAVLKAGGAFMPVDAASPPSRIQYMAADSKAKLLLNAGVESVDLQDCEVLTVDEDMFQGNPANLEPTAGGRDVLYVIYTSGTTGTPKGVQISHSNLHNLFVHHQRQSNITLSGRVLHASAIGFDVCYQEMLLTLLSGGELVVIDDHVKKTPHLLLQYVTDNQIDTMFLPTAYFNFLIREDDEVDALFASSVKHIVVAGEALILSSRFMDLLRSSSKSLHNHYGPSETHVVSALTINRDSDLQMRPSIGEPIANTEFYIVDQHLRLVPRGVVGELCIAGQSLGLGYLNQPELTRLAFVPNPVDKGTIMYRTGDLARWLPDGKVELIGRSDHQVKIRGYRIEPAEITAILLRHKEVSEAAATVKEQADGSKELCLFYVAETPLTPAYIRSYLAEKLPAFMIPSHIVPLKAMPFSANGKVDYRALPSAEKAQPPSMPAASAAPLTGLERQLAEIFAEVLEIKDIGREDNFFEQGGHSLRAMRAVSKIGKKLNRKLSLRDIFLHPSVRTLASFMDGQEARPFQAIPAAEAMRTYPLTSAQKRLFILEQYKGIGTSYNLSSALLVEGSLNVRQVEHVYQQLLRRHEILRTIFFMEGEEPVQQVVEQATGSIWYKEAPDSSEAELQELVSAFVRPFRMQEAPMLRIGLIRLNEKKHLFLIDMHHIVADGTSIGILVEEFMRLYRGESLPPLPVSYKDFTVWQKRRLLAPEMAEKERFWLERLAGELPVLQLPTDYSRPPQQRFEGKMLPFELDKALAVKLTELSHKTGATLYMILLSAFQVLLHKYSGSEDVLIGIPVAGRSHEDVEGAVGMFVNTLPFRGKPEPAKRFHDFMAEVKEELLLAFEHQDYPLELMIEKLNLKFDPSRNPLFTVIFDMQNMRVPELRLDDLTISVWRSEHISSKFDLSVSVHEHSEGIRFNCEYATSLFEQETVERLFRHYEALLSRIFVNPDARIQELNMVPDEEQDRILTAFNQPVTPVDERMLAHHVFERWAAKTPHAPAVAWMDTMLTYHELNQLANELCYVLQAKGTAANDVIAIYMNKSLDMVIAMLAILKAGAAFLPLDPEYPLERVQYAVDNSGAKIVIADASHCARVSCQTVLTYQHEKSRLEESCFPNPENDVQLHHLAYVIYTSGSTGNPKGVRVPHRGLANLTHFFALDWNAAQGERVTQMASFAFDMALLEIFTALLTGAALYLVPKETVLRPSSLAEFMNENRITIMTVTPSYLAYLEPDDFRTLRLLITAGEAISVHDYERWSRLEYVNLYGPTETTIITTMWRPDSSSRIKQSVPIGKPLPNTQIYILNQAGSLQPIGIVGEIYVGGEGVTQGYIQLPSTTAKHYLDNPFRLGERMYRTGDLGRWLPDGSIEYAGRIDEQVKLRGHRIEIGEIEHALLKHAAIKEAAVIHRIDGNQDGYLCAFIVEQEQVPAQELKDFLANVLPVYMLPSAFVRLDKLPVTSNGKIDKKQLKSMPIDVAGEAEYEEPANDLQRKLVALWEKNLKVAPIGIAHNFFDLGGQSLKATKLIAEIERDMQITISLRELYQYQTIKQLAQYLEERAGDE
ncbi:hypothetical protein J27TS7_35290 [Paenibacillus dendritiformis]|uniref:non-ribosomal peptide synthetase n=1 Tax=Paenibacillus dendritiformis TaxID=130049 RepID=UPI001B29B2B2|nr:non-ribosomal peptide synthetase [Paenibacillus dendritiformis]GIO74015.1 hypothetical protein J27TS7_35290 [Paenibacillus dendritiformis]